MQDKNSNSAGVELVLDQGARERYSDVVQDVLAMAKKAGATAAETSLSLGKGMNVNVRLGEVETVEYNRDQGVSITVYVGQQKGSASSTDLSRDSLQRTVQAACDIARATSEDPCNGLADPALLATEFPDLDLYHPWDLSMEQAIAQATECEAAARAHDPRISNSEGAGISSHEGLRIYGNSSGFLHGYPTSRHSISCVVIAGSGDGMQRDYWYSVSRDAGQLEAVDSIGRRAAERTVRRLDARRLSTREAPVLFEASLASSLFSSFIGAISGGSQYRKTTFLLDCLDKQVFPDYINLREEPLIPGGLASAPYDSEGVATRARDLVAGGVVKSYVLSSYSARKLGLQATGNAGGTHNVLVSHGVHDFAGLLKKMHTGLLVTDMMGQGVNKTTGDYSRGAAGFWVENGEILYPVQEITIAGNLRDMFRDIVDVGTDVDSRRSLLTGSVLLERMTIAGE